MNIHKDHKVLGDYCWNCQRPVVAGVPGWPRPSRDDGPNDIEYMPSVVIWADGTEDVSRECAVCKGKSCKYPVHLEEYAETEDRNEL